MSIVSYKDKDEYLTTEYTYGYGLISETTFASESEAGSDQTEADGGEDDSSEANSADRNTLYHHYNNLGSTVKLTDESGVVVESYSYGTYGELLGGSTELTEFLYNGRSGVITDENALYYMRARYYAPEIKRFINQDVVRGSITNSQSLNRYSYVQGNPVSYTDPFGLSPLSGLFTNTNFIHGVLGLLGCVPGAIGIVANIADAIIYAVVDKDYGMAALSLLNAATLGVAARASSLAKAASKSADIAMKLRRCNTIEHALKLVSNSANIYRAGVDIYNASISLIDNYYANGGHFGKGAGWDFFAIGLSVATAIVSGKGVADDGMALFNAFGLNKAGGAAVRGVENIAASNTTTTAGSAVGGQTGAHGSGAAAGVGIGAGSSSGHHSVSGGSSKSSGYYKDANGRWHRPNGQFASNAEMGISTPTKTTSGTHGNSLSDTRTNYGYALVNKNTNEILKFGETLYPDTRYSQKFLNDNNAKMVIMEQGSKSYIHDWQHDLNMYYKHKYGIFPPSNKGGW